MRNFEKHFILEFYSKIKVLRNVKKFCEIFYFGISFQNKNFEKLAHLVGSIIRNALMGVFWLKAYIYIYIYIVIVFKFQNTTACPPQKLQESNKILWLLFYWTFVFQLYKLHFLTIGLKVVHGEQTATEGKLNLHCNCRRLKESTKKIWFAEMENK